MTLLVTLWFPHALQAADAEIRLCNDGEVPIYVASAEETWTWFKVDVVELQGWQVVEPGERDTFFGLPTATCPLVYSEPLSRRGENHWLAFAIRDEDGRLGAVYYPTAQQSTPPPRYCLEARDFRKDGSPSEMQQCGDGETLVRFSVGLRILSSESGKATLRYTVSPKASDAIEAYLEPPD